jgi:hypothetical protein
VLDGKITIKDRKEVLGSDSVTCLVKEDIAELLARLVGSEEGEEDHDLGYSVEGSSVYCQPSP